jgi:hypothetical protein
MNEKCIVIPPPIFDPTFDKLGIVITLRLRQQRTNAREL